jgi:hypothetical protein
MSKATEKRLIELASLASTPTRRITPMQLAVELLEVASSQMTTSERP